MTALACIVLAAGASVRFGGDKRQVKNAQGETLLGLTLTSIPPIFVQRLLVLRSGDEMFGSVYENNWQVIYAQHANQGMGHSIAAAVGHMGECTGCLIALGDMPLVRAETYLMLGKAARPDRIIVPFFEHKRGNPVLVGRDFFAELADLKGDSGARQLMQRHAQFVERLDVSDQGILRDMDTPAELAQIPGFSQPK